MTVIVMMANDENDDGDDYGDYWHDNQYNVLPVFIMIIMSIWLWLL